MADNTRARIWVGGLPRGIQEEEVHSKFARYGKIEWIKVRSSPRDVFAFVQYEDDRDAEDAVEGMNQSQAFGGTGKGGVIKVAAACDPDPSSKGKGGHRWRSPSPDTVRLWCGGFPDKISEDEVRDNFSKFGKLKYVAVRSSKTDNFAFIDFASMADAKAAIEAMNGAQAFGTTKEASLTVRMSSAAAGGKGERRRHRSGSPRSRSSNGSRSRGGRSKSRSRSRPKRRSVSASRSPVGRYGGGGKKGGGKYGRSRSRSAGRGKGGGKYGRSRSRSRGKGGGGKYAGDRAPKGSGKRGGSPSPQRRQLDSPVVKVENLPSDIDEEELMSIGSDFGKVLQVKVWGFKGKRFGSLTYSRIEHAVEAFRELHGRKVEGWEKTLKAQIPCQCCGHTWW